MPVNPFSSTLIPEDVKGLSGWDRAIAEAKERIKEIKRSITRFESLKAQGMEFPEPKGGGKKRAKRKSEGATSKRPVTRSALSVTDPTSPLSDR